MPLSLRPATMRLLLLLTVFCYSVALLSTHLHSNRLSFVLLQSSSSAVCSPTWEAYSDAIQAVLRSGRVHGKKRLSAEELLEVKEYLLSSEPLLKQSAIPDDLPNSSIDLRGIFARQRQRFLNETGFSHSQYELTTRCLTYMGDRGAKTRNPQSLAIAWSKIKESGIVLRETSLSTYMYVLSLDQAFRDDCLEVASFHDILFEPSEKTISLRIKTLIETGDALEAESLLSSLPEKGACNEWKRLRTYAPILQYYCTNGDMGSALRLFRQMRNSPGVYFDSDTYGLLLGSLAKRGCFCPEADAIDGTLAAGFSAESGPLLFDQIVSEMAHDILELSESVATELEQSLRFGFSPSSDGKLFGGRVAVDSTTALCPKTGAKLRLEKLDSGQRQSVYDTLFSMAAVQQEEFMLRKRNGHRSSKNEPDKDYAVRELTKFIDWMNERVSDPYTAIVDGPNVAYFGHGDVHYSQVKLVVEELERMGEKPLVIMPQKYVAPSFRLSVGALQELSEREQEVVDQLLKNEKMYAVSAKCLDDYYWMISSVCYGDLRVSSNRSGGRFPGLRPMLVTNDQMRDHKLELLESRLFRRWTSCHVVNYNISIGEEWERRDVHFFPADVFSREIQANEGTVLGRNATAWHFPVTNWNEPDRFCVAIAS